MADTLDAMLEPGERVVYRESLGWLPVQWPTNLGFLSMFAALFAARAADLAKMALVLLAFVTITSVFVGAFGFARRRSTGALVTERRVLYRNMPMNPREGRIVLAEIETVAFVPWRGVAITTRDRRVILMTGLRKPQPFAAAVAEAADLRRPALPGPLARMEEFALYLGGAAGFVFAVVLFEDWLDAMGKSESFAHFAERMLGFLPLGVASFWAGAQATCVLGLVALRRRTSAEQARTWLHWRSDDKWERRFERWFLWRNPPYVWLASLLWGEPMEPPKDGASAHG